MFKIITLGARYLMIGYVLNKKSGARFAKPSDYSSYLNGRHKGLLLDGQNMRLSEKESFKNVCVVARVGAGKTSRYIIPNILDKARKQCSIIINDPKGEVFDQTSGYLQHCGYKILVIDPENISRSSYFNPLTQAQSDIELEQIAEILVRSGIPSSGDKDDFWLQGAIRFVSLFIKCLKNAGEENPAYFNLHNLYFLFQNFGKDGCNLMDFMSRYTVCYDCPEDESLWNEWKGVLTGNISGVQSFVLNAITALKSLSNQKIAKLTSKSDIQLENIRREKTAIYFITPAQHAEYYSFLTSLFFRSVFNACMRKMPNKKTLPVYIMFDEFGHATIPNFVSTANTIRGYNVSLSIILQSISQLNARYGKDYADSIQGGFNTYITYPGADPQTSQFFENIIGRTREKQLFGIDGQNSQYHEYNLVNAAEVRMLDPNEALIVSGREQTIKLRTQAYFENWKFKRLAKIGACHIQDQQKNETLQTVAL